MMGATPIFHIPKQAQVIIVSDLFADDFQGGAEFTTEALIEATDLSVFKVHSRSVTPEIVEKNKDKAWVLGNFTQLSLYAIHALVEYKCKYHVIEYDYKFCLYRAPKLHEFRGEGACDCASTQHGRFIIGFYKRAQRVWFMSFAQGQLYRTFFPQMSSWSNLSVLGSLWSEEHINLLGDIRLSRELSSRPANGKFMIMGGGSWVKNQEATEAYLRAKKVPYDVVGGLRYEEFLKKMSEYDGLCFHPAGHDTDPRLVWEAKIIGLRLDLNDMVQSRQEVVCFDSSDSQQGSQLDSFNSWVMSQGSRKKLFWTEITREISNDG